MNLVGTSRMRQLVGSMIFTRLLLTAFATVPLVASLFLLHLSPTARLVVLIQGISPFSSAVGLTCVFQGLQRMRMVTSREFFASLISMIGILCLVHKPGDVIMAAGVSYATTVLTNLPILFRYGREFGAPRIRLPGRQDWHIARTSMACFWSLLMLTITYNIHILLIGMLRNDTDVGLFTAG